jgi:hypothetical protein
MTDRPPKSHGTSGDTTETSETPEGHPRRNHPRNNRREGQDIRHRPVDPAGHRSDERLVRKRMAETVRLVVTHRERAPRSPRMERALKRLLLRYSQMARELRNWSEDVQQ